MRVGHFPCPSLRPLMRGLLLLWLAWCGAAPAQPPAATALPDRVLLMSSRELPVIQYLQKHLAAGGLGDPPLPPLKTDWVKVTSGAEARAAIERLKPQLGQYRAIYTPSQTYARGAQLAGATLPIVFDGVDNPVRLCLVDSLQHPGRNATGYMHYLPDTEGKMLQTLHDAFPQVKEVLYLVSGPAIPPKSCAQDDAVWTSAPKEPCRPGLRAADPYVQRRANAGPLQAQGRALGMKVSFMVVCTLQDFAALPQATRRAGMAVMVPWQTLFDNHQQALVDVLTRARVPVIFPRHQYVRAGGLLSLEPVTEAIPDRSSLLALTQVLNGHSPAQLPVHTPRGFSLHVNAGAAHRTGQHPSLLVLRRADVVVQ